MPSSLFLQLRSPGFWSSNANYEIHLVASTLASFSESVEDCWSCGRSGKWCKAMSLHVTDISRHKQDYWHRALFTNTSLCSSSTAHIQVALSRIRSSFFFLPWFVPTWTVSYSLMDSILHHRKSEIGNQVYPTGQAGNCGASAKGIIWGDSPCYWQEPLNNYQMNAFTTERRAAPVGITWQDNPIDFFPTLDCTYPDRQEQEPTTFFRESCVESPPHCLMGP